MYIENPIVSTKNYSTSRFGNIVGYKVNIQILMAFLYTNTEISGKKTMKKVHYYSNKKNKVPRNKFNQGSKRLVLGKIENTEERN